jgi:hypothetical protein
MKKISSAWISFLIKYYRKLVSERRKDDWDNNPFIIL